jgi:phosphoenolpyruvate carboxykinase (ATP)
MVAAALDGSLSKVPIVPDPIFGLGVPAACPGVPSEVLQPRHTWPDKAEYDRVATALARSFEANFAEFAPTVSAEVRAAGPRVK